MSRVDKLLERVLRGTADANLRFADLCNLLRRLGFDERIRGDHHIFTRAGIAEILNLQPRAGAAKPYQVKQVRQMILAYNLGGEDNPQPKKDKSTASQPAPPPGSKLDENDGS